jgi:hypothetical protein
MVTPGDADAKLRSLIQTPSHFQRSISLKYDLGSAERIAVFIPTFQATAAIEHLLRATEPGAQQRAFVLHGAYGAGKSLLGVVLAALFSRANETEEASHVILERLMRHQPEAAEAVKRYIQTNRRLLPVLLSGDEGELGFALGRALNRALQRNGLHDLRPPTVYQAVLDTITMWRSEFTETYTRLGETVQARHGRSLEHFIEALSSGDPVAYDQFVALYSDLTAGAVFYSHNGQSIVDVYAATTAQLSAHGYDGIVILYDEFGRFLEGRVGQPFGREAALLQDLAEHCNRSGDAQVHLVLITHQRLTRYAYGLPEAYQTEWQRIEGRFRSLDVSSDPEVSYLLIVEALQPVSQQTWQTFVARYQSSFEQLLLSTVDAALFEPILDPQLRALIIEGAYPLHPVSTYCLPRLSARVAQNERTLFTFLASDETYSVGRWMRETSPNCNDLPHVYPDQLWDYFADAIRADTGPGGVHSVWTAVQNTLRKVDPGDQLATRLVKTLGVIHAVGVTGPLKPTTRLLAFALSASVTEITPVLEQLTARKALVSRKSAGYWEFIEGSDVDFEAAIADVVQRKPVAKPRLRRYLEDVLPPRHYTARRYNDERGMIRFFWSLYRTVPELIQWEGHWDALLKEMGYADGLLIYILAMDAADVEQAEALIRRTGHPRVAFVLPEAPLAVLKPLTELYALRQLEADPTFKDPDPRIADELAFFIEDTTARLALAMAPLTDPHRQARWFVAGQEIHGIVNSPGHISRLLSHICDRLFDRTPRLYNEAFNKRKPSGVQARAAEKVIDAFLTEELGENLGLTGHGPDVQVLNTILKATDLLKPDDQGRWHLSRPEDEASEMAKVWQVIKTFFDSAVEPAHRTDGNELSFDPLIDRLQSPPYGLRLGVLPLLIAAVFHQYLPVATVRQGSELVSPIEGKTFTQLCHRPDVYTVSIQRWNEERHAIIGVLQAHFRDRVLPEERRHQPLYHLSLGMLRWLQALPKYVRETRHLSEEALAFRQITQTAMHDPARAIFTDLGQLLTSDAEEGDLRRMMNRRLVQLMGEIEASYLDLQRRLDRFIIEYFTAADSVSQADGSLGAMSDWLRRLEAQTGVDLSTELLGDTVAEGLVTTIQQAGISSPTHLRDTDFLGRLARCIVGLPLRDWSDETERAFCERLIEVKARIERELETRAETPEDLIEVALRVPRQDIRHFQFRDTDLSPAAQLLLGNLKGTLDIVGRALSPDERRRIAVAFLDHVLNNRGTKSE